MGLSGKLGKDWHKSPDFSKLDQAANTHVVEVMEQFGGVAGHKNRRIHYLTGGAAWALTVFVKPNELVADKSDRIEVTQADFDAFYKLATARQPDGQLALFPDCP